MTRRAVTGALSVGAFLLLWQFVGSHQIVSASLISYPTQIVQSMGAMIASGELAANGAVSLTEFAYGLLPAIVAGIALGLTLALNRTVRLLCDPVLTAIYQAPAIAFVPIVVVWFGIGMSSKVAMVFFSALFPVMINTTTGVEGISETWVRAVRAYGGSLFHVVTKAILPGALPSIMTGVRLALGRATVALIAAEMYASFNGIGRLVQQYSAADRAPEIFVLVIVISGFGYACVLFVRALEGWLAKWRLEFEQ
ncbi:MAG: ABC transporter permease [Candidatus Lustribacter sp.]